MVQRTSGSRTARSPGRRAYVLVMLGLVAVTAILVGVASFGMETLSQVRAYVGGEGRWSKAEKAAVQGLLRYAATRDEAYYRRHLQALEVPLGDRRARLALDEPSYDFRVVHDGFVAGGNAPEDTAGLATLYRRFRDTSLMKEAVRVWIEADGEILALQSAGERLHQVIAAGQPDPAAVEAILADVDRIDVRVTKLENDFSSALGAAARRLNRALFGVLLGTGLLLVAVVGGFTFSLFERLRGSEEELRRSESVHRRLVEEAPVGIVRSRPDGTLVAVNPAFAAMLGYTEVDELLSKNTARDLYVDPECRARLLSTIKPGDVTTAETTARRKDGRTIAVRISACGVADEGSEGESFTAIIEDVTRTRMLEEQVRRAQKMEAVGQLAAGVAHDFNNLLTVILGAASIVRMELPGGHAALEEVDQIDDACDRAVKLTRQLLTLGGRQPLSPQRLDLNAVVRGAEKLLRALLGDNVALVLELAPDPLPIRADHGQLGQVLVNLAANARDAMPTGGTLTLETKSVRRDEVPDDAPRQGDATEYVRLRVEDTGVGMDEATLARVFDPFFTTKPLGKGTGLGLATVHGIVRQSGGRVTVRSEIGRGTTFDVYLPCAPGALESADAGQGTSESVRGAETVLVVEDEEPVRRLTSRALRARGYTVLEASNGEEALRVADAHAGEIDLLATDVMMPGMNGREVATAILRRRPRARVLYLSGYAGDALVREGVLEPGIVLLSKPFTGDQLARKVRDVLSKS